MRRLRAIAVLLVLALTTARPALAAGPEVTVTAPTQGATVTGSSVTVSFTTANITLVPTTVAVAEAGQHPEANKPGEGHLHFVLDLQPLVVWSEPDAYTFSNILPGEHQLMVELVNNDHSSLSPRVMQMVQFQVAPGALPVSGGSEPAPALLGLCALLLLAGGWLILQRARVRVWPAP